VTSDGERALATLLKWAKLDAGVETEYRFDVTRKWRFDFAWPAQMIAVEVEGGTWSSGRHSRGAGFEADCTKYNEAALLGWLVLRVTPKMIDDNRAVFAIERALKARRRFGP